jgi:hypothetical protein
LGKGIETNPNDDDDVMMRELDGARSSTGKTMDDELMERRRRGNGEKWRRKKRGCARNNGAADPKVEMEEEGKDNGDFATTMNDHGLILKLIIRKSDDDDNGFGDIVNQKEAKQGMEGDIAICSPLVPKAD